MSDFLHRNMCFYYSLYTALVWLDWSVLMTATLSPVLLQESPVVAWIKQRTEGLHCTRTRS